MLANGMPHPGGPGKAFAKKTPTPALRRAAARGRPIVPVAAAQLARRVQQNPPGSPNLEDVMIPEQTDRYHRQLIDLGRRVGVTADALEEAARSPTSGEAAGNLSNAPMHLGDMGSEVYTQELNATLLENEEFIRSEVATALDRIEAGTFGVCEECGRAIPAERLDALPYTRHCVACAEKL